MKVITKKTTNAFLEMREIKISNTEVRNKGLYLFGNLIARHDENGRIEISNRGWFTNTTKERLNALPNVHIVQRNYIWYLNGEKWDGKPITINQ